MAAFAEPQPGLVISYSYLWSEESERGRVEGRKDRPCAIIVAIEQPNKGQRKAVTEFERIRRAVRALNKIRMLEPDDLLRTGVASRCNRSIHGALPRRAQSSGTRESTLEAHRRRAISSPCPASPAPRWNAWLLSSRSSLSFAHVFGQFGHEEEQRRIRLTASAPFVLLAIMCPAPSRSKEHSGFPLRLA